MSVAAALPLLFAGPLAAAELGYAVDAHDGTIHQAGPDTPFNPASLVKAATSLWALETLGPDHRFRTRFVRTPDAEVKDGVLHGDLWVLGGRDPDFHQENAWHVADALHRAGIRRVHGTLRVTDGFWIGWEGGSESTQRDDSRRRLAMAERLAGVWNPASWNGSRKRAWAEWAPARGRAADAPPSLPVLGVSGESEPPEAWIPLVDHEGNRLADLLRRFNAYSNNDLERLGATLGTPDELVRFLKRRLPEGTALPTLETLSGLGVNRWTPRGVTVMLRELDATAASFGLPLDAILPTAGCDPGTLERFKTLGASFASRLAGKTGTLTRTDGGVAVLGGRLSSERGPIYFCLAETRSGADVASARGRLERRVLGVLGSNDPGGDGACEDDLPSPDRDLRLHPYPTDGRAPIERRAAH